MQGVHLKLSVILTWSLAVALLAPIAASADEAKLVEQVRFEEGLTSLQKLEAELSAARDDLYELDIQSRSSQRDQRDACYYADRSDACNAATLHATLATSAARQQLARVNELEGRRSDALGDLAEIRREAEGRQDHANFERWEQVATLAANHAHCDAVAKNPKHATQADFESCRHFIADQCQDPTPLNDAQKARCNYLAGRLTTAEFDQLTPALKQKVSGDACAREQALTTPEMGAVIRHRDQVRARADWLSHQLAAGQDDAGHPLPAKSTERARDIAAAQAEIQSLYFGPQPDSVRSLNARVAELLAERRADYGHCESYVAANGNRPRIEEVPGTPWAPKAKAALPDFDP